MNCRGIGRIANNSDNTPKLPVSEAGTIAQKAIDKTADRIIKDVLKEAKANQRFLSGTGATNKDGYIHISQLEEILNKWK